MRFLFALVLGAMSAVLLLVEVLYVLSWVAIVPLQREEATLARVWTSYREVFQWGCAGFLAIALFASMYLMLVRTKSAWMVFTRGSLIGTVEWLVVIPVSFLAAGGAVVAAASTQQNGEEAATGAVALVGAMMSGAMSSALALPMAGACLVCALFGFLMYKAFAD